MQTPLAPPFHRSRDPGTLKLALADCDLPKLAQQFAAGGAEKEDWDQPSPSDFPGWLVANGHAMPVEAAEVHLGNYGEWEPEFGVKP